MAVKPIPEGYRSVTPYLIVDGAANLIDFMTEAFGAAERGGRLEAPGGKVGHAEVTIGDSVIMVADPDDENPATRSMLMLYVEDCDATYAKAVAAGATSRREPETQFYGDRSAMVEDAAGNLWAIQTHVEDVAPEEMARRAQELYGQG